MNGGSASRMFKFFVPTFDEISLFLMSAGFLALYAIDSVLRDEFYRYVFLGFGAWHLLLLSMSAAGIFYSLYHVFTEREKTGPERVMMFAFAVVVTYATAIAAGIYIMRESPLWFLVFPAWNVFGGIVLVFLATFRAVDEDAVEDDNATVGQVIIGLMFLVLILAACEYYFRLYWAITFSICVGYAGTLSRCFQWMSNLYTGTDDSDAEATAM